MDPIMIVGTLTHFVWALLGWIWTFSRWAIRFVTAIAMVLSLFGPGASALLVLISYLTLTNTGGFVWLLLDLAIGKFRSAPPPEIIIPDSPQGFGAGWLVVGSLVGLLLGALLALLIRPRYVRTKVTKRVVETPDKGPVEEFIFEAMQPGSQFFSTQIPSFQAKLYVQVNDVWYRGGGVSRTEYGLVTANHVLTDAQKVKIVRGSDVLELEASQFEHLEHLGDLAVARNVHPTFLTQGKLAKVGVTERSGIMVMLHNGEQASMGPLQQDEGSFGILRYCGSSVKGFSGSPYYMGKTIYGFHVGSMGTNYGYDAAYLTLMTKLEDSSDRIASEIADGYEHRMRPSPFNPDEVFVSVKGNFCIMDADVYYKARKGQLRIDEAAPRTPVVDFTDSENFVRPAAPLCTAGRLSKVECPVEDTILLTTSETTDPSPKSGCQPCSTDLPGLIPAPRSSPSNITSEFILESARTLPANKVREVAQALLAASKTEDQEKVEHSKKWRQKQAAKLKHELLMELREEMKSRAPVVQQPEKSRESSKRS